ncbi:porin [uncultured Hyphomicrobium sp.]|uniref:porin n=1 Tax=uncultured Hyphomicrobium sp. TaxID=194373 RepID=UPI0025F790F3|nr:porin [uncultured Hyphomicrobium sp.]
MKKQSLYALAAAGLLAGGMSVTSASAADLGGNCCADLEERIAELEATTARKGNRKVSLTISGWVAEQVMWWDDGEESNVYVGGIGTTIGTNVKFTGQATIVPGWTAGYVIHIEADGSEGLLAQDEDTDNGKSVYTGSNNYVHTLQSYWFIKSESLGKLSVGLQSQASDNTAILVDGSGSLIPANYVQFDWGAFNVGAFATCADCNGVPLNSVRYDTPTFAGFSASATWGEDDFWDVALRYAGEFAGFKLAAAAAYSESDDDCNGTRDFSVTPSLCAGTQGSNGTDTTQFFQVGAYVQHVPTGLFVYGAYGDFEEDLAGGVESNFYYVKGGLRQRWTPLGHTVLYGEYENMDGESAGTNLDLWGAGVVQEIDNAAMSLWLTYRHIEGDDDAGNSAEFDYVKAGALINF